MGVYLNSRGAYTMFRRDCASAYFVDKSEMLAEGECGEKARLESRKGAEVCDHHQTAPFRKDCYGKYDCILFRERGEQRQPFLQFEGVRI